LTDRKRRSAQHHRGKEADVMIPMSNQQQSENTQRAQEPRTGIPEIHEQEAHRRYKLVYADNETVERTAEEIVYASRMLSNRTLWHANFMATMQFVRAWCAARRSMIKMVLVDIRSNKTLFHFVPRSDRYDLALGNQMTALEVELSGTFGIGYVESLQVPERSLDRFVSERALLVWDENFPADLPAKTAEGLETT
jgi:hypothetical protein